MVLLPVANLQEMARAASLTKLDEQRAGYPPSSEGGPGTVREKDLSEGRYDELVSAGRQAVLRSLCEGGVFNGDEKELWGCISKEIVIDPEEWEARWAKNLISSLYEF